MTPPPTGTSPWVWLAAVVAVAFVPAVFAYLGTRSTKRVLGQVRDQVQNSHTTNLRDDLDEKFEAVGNDLATLRRELTGEVVGLRTEVLQDRDDARESRREIHRRLGRVEDRVTAVERHVSS